MIIDAYDRRTTAQDMCDFHTRSKRQSSMGGCQRIHIESFTTCRTVPMKWRHTRTPYQTVQCPISIVWAVPIRGPCVPAHPCLVALAPRPAQSSGSSCFVTSPENHRPSGDPACLHTQPTHYLRADTPPRAIIRLLLASFLSLRDRVPAGVIWPALSVSR